jgi:hypothetical protein
MARKPAGKTRSKTAARSEGGAVRRHERPLAGKNTAPKTARKAKHTKPSAKSATQAAAAVDADAKAPKFVWNETVIRMYRQGLGDCFLVFLPKENGTFFKIMIDCGVIVGQADGKERNRDVVADVIKATGGSVDILVVTHEHWDHVSGFDYASDLFCTRDEPAGGGKLKVGCVWFAWTENSDDPTARVLQGGLKTLLEKVAGVGAALESPALALAGTPQGDSLIRGYRQVLSFFGHDPDLPIAPPSGFGVAAGTNKTRAAMKAAAGLSKQIEYCDPDARKPWSHKDVPGVRIFTLGPPRDPNALRRTDPGKAGYRAAIAEPDDLSMAIDALSSAVDGGAPFTGSSLPRPGQPSAGADPPHPFIQRYYLDDVLDEGPDGGRAQGPVDQDWRRIDDDWIAGASEFALALDGQTNNTSLVLAIELAPDGPVLLFVADAQAGNWMSWEALVWSFDGRRVTSRDLLARTTFLKVGHHGSHNATLKGLGLELMTRRELIAAVPVDRVTARKKRWNEMPLLALMDELVKKTSNRVVLSEVVPPDGAQAYDGAGFTDNELIRTPLYFEFRRSMNFG